MLIYQLSQLYCHCFSCNGSLHWTGLLILSLSMTFTNSLSITLSLLSTLHLHHFGSTNQTRFSQFALLLHSISSCISNAFLEMPPRPLSRGRGEEEKRISFFPFCPPLLAGPASRGSSLPRLHGAFTPSPRPRVRGPAPTLLNKLGCLPGPVCGVREKKANRALSLSLLLHLLFFTVFTQATSPQESEPEKVLFYLVDSQEYGFLRQLYRRSPQKGEIPKFTCAQVCECNLPRAQWLQECQVHSVGNGYPSLPTICTHFTDTHCSMTLCYTHSIHWSQSKGSSCSPFSASNCDIPCHDSLRGLYLPISSLSASISQSFCSSLACGASILTTPDLTPKNGSLYLPFSASNCVIWCHVVFGESPPCAHMGFFLPTTLPPECGLRRLHSSNRVLELDLLYSDPRRFLLYRSRPDHNQRRRG